MNEPLRLLILGAHPDDPEFHAGGLETIYRQRGHVVKLVSVTNGEAGHHECWGPSLVERRRVEATAAAAVIGAISEVWDYPDGRLEPTLDVRMRVIREIREFKPDLVLTHRPDDYHPDHRAVGHLVRDASYLITVPGIVPDVPILHRSPIIGYLPDHFTRPYRLSPDVIVDVTAHVSTVVEMLACHESQFYEWLPFNQGILEQVPVPEEGNRKQWLRQWYSQWFLPTTERYREELIRQFGQQRGETMQFVEIFEISEYGSPLDEASRDRLFGFATSS